MSDWKDIASLRDLRESFRKKKLEWATKGRLYVVNLIRDQFLSGQVLNRRTGTGVRSIQSESKVIDSGDGFTVGTNVNYMVAWEFGFTRKQYVIEAKNAKALAFEIGGKTVFAKRVTIPAKTFGARPYIQPALAQSEPYLTALGEKVFAEAVRESIPDSIQIIFGGGA
jgi:hypothetical protein